MTPMDTLLQDVRYAARTLVKNPGFAALTILCLAMGIGVNSTIFSVVDTIAIRPLPFADPERLVTAGTMKIGSGQGQGVSYVELQEWRARTHAFETIAAVSNRTYTLSDGAESERFDGALVSWDLFPML